MSSVADLHHFVRPAAGEPAGALVLMHGRGTSEHDLAPLLDELDPDRRLLGIAPRGPLSLPPGGAHWYVVRRVGFPDPPTFRSSLARLTGWLDAILGEAGIAVGRTVVGGFSQGAAMAYAVGLGGGRPAPAGILAMSGFIPTAESVELELEGREGLPVAIAHGTLDPIIGVEWGRDARDRLQAAGVDVLYRESEIPHAVDPRLLPTLADWLRRTLAPSPA